HERPSTLPPEATFEGGLTYAMFAGISRRTRPRSRGHQRDDAGRRGGRRLQLLATAVRQQHRRDRTRAASRGSCVHDRGVAPPGFRAVGWTVEPDVMLPLTAYPFVTDTPLRALGTSGSFWVRTAFRVRS